jgi:tripartite-type tricarboxylate transporter receptor subunit TctC
LQIRHPKNVQVKNLKEFIELLKKNPGKFNYASAGNGSSHHLAGEQFKMLTKTFITHIPYRGAGPAMQDLIAGQVDIEFDGLGSSAAQIKNGSIVALAVASQKRAPGFPTVPTAAEAGLVGYEVSTWYGLFAPKGTPQPIIDKMTFEVQKAINTPDLKTIWTNNGSDTPNLSGDAFGKFVAGDIKRWAAVAKASGAKLD